MPKFQPWRSIWPARGTRRQGSLPTPTVAVMKGGWIEALPITKTMRLTPRSLITRTFPGKWLLENVMSYWDFYDKKWISLQSRGRMEIDDAFLGWLRQRRPDRPFFAFLNYFDAHEPFVPPAECVGRFGISPRNQRDYQYLFDYVGAEEGCNATSTWHVIVTTIASSTLMTSSIGCSAN